jgi:hypothetical protein
MADFLYLRDPSMLNTTPLGSAMAKRIDDVWGRYLPNMHGGDVARLQRNARFAQLAFFGHLLSKPLAGEIWTGLRDTCILTE